MHKAKPISGTGSYKSQNENLPKQFQLYKIPTPMPPVLWSVVSIVG
jgi:hypothetical protein